MPDFSNAGQLLLWLCIVVITALWVVVAFFVKRHIDNTKQRLDTHAERLDNLQTKIAETNVSLAGKAPSTEIAELYNWSKQEFHKVKENEINPLRQEVDEMRTELHSDMQGMESRMTKAINAVRVEIKQDIKLVIGLLRKTPDDT